MMRIRAISTVIFLVVLFSTIALFATQNTLEYFKADSDREEVALTWRSGAENNIVEYHVIRSSNDSPTNIGSVKAEGDYKNYKFVDTQPFLNKTVKNSGDGIQSEKTLSYRLKFVYSDHSFDYSEKVDVTYNTSVVTSTWGMIKEMFR